MAYDGEIIELGDLVPEFRPVKLRRNGEVVELQGHVDGRRCPVSVKAQVSQAYGRYRERMQSGDAAQQGGASLLLDRDILFAVIPGIELGEADLLAGDGELTNRVLHQLQWLKDDAEGEASGEETTTTSPSTTDTSSPASTRSTARKTGAK